MVYIDLKNPEILLDPLAPSIDVWDIAVGLDVQWTLDTVLLQGY